MFHIKRGSRRAVTTTAGLAVLAVTATPALSTAATGAPRVAAPPRAVAVRAASVVPEKPTAMTIKTVNNDPVNSKDVKVPGTMTLLGTDYALTIKGRGHSTWVWPKKPYKIELDKKASLFGMPENKDWVLLANYCDRTSLRNYMALRLANEATGLAWTPHTHFVDLTLNGKRLGTYLLTEQIKQSSVRVDLPDGGLLFELDDRFDQPGGDPGFRSSHKLPFTFNDPEPGPDPEKDLSPAQVAAAKATVNQFEKVLYGRNFKNPTTGYRKYVNVSSFIDWYLVDELFKTVDADWWASTYITWAPDRKKPFAMGPPWDFDMSAGYNAKVGPSVKDPTRWWVRAGEKSTHKMHNTHWIARMFQDPWFARLVKKRWAALKPDARTMVNQIPAMSSSLGSSVRWDYQHWHSGTAKYATRGVHGKTYAAEVSFLQSWMNKRMAWMNSKLR